MLFRSIAAEFLEAFDRLYEPSDYLKRAADTCRRLPPPLHGVQRRPHQLGRRLRAAAILLWRQGVRRSTRWLLWRHLAELLLRRPALLEDFLWMLALEEHVLAYRAEVHEQVEAQLRVLAAANSPSPLSQGLEAQAHQRQCLVG